MTEIPKSPDNNIVNAESPSSISDIRNITRQMRQIARAKVIRALGSKTTFEEQIQALDYIFKITLRDPEQFDLGDFTDIAQEANEIDLTTANPLTVILAAKLWYHAQSLEKLPMAITALSDLLDSNKINIPLQIGQASIVLANTMALYQNLASTDQLKKIDLAKIISVLESSLKKLSRSLNQIESHFTEETQIIQFMEAIAESLNDIEKSLKQD